MQQGSRHIAATALRSRLSVDTDNSMRTVSKEPMMLSRFCSAKTLIATSDNDVSISKKEVTRVTIFAVLGGMAKFDQVCNRIIILAKTFTKISA